jgi:hypothetical protein
MLMIIEDSVANYIYLDLSAEFAAVINLRKFTAANCAATRPRQ